MKKKVENINYILTRVQKPRSAKLHENRVITTYKPGAWLESYKMLRTRILQVMDSNSWTTFAISGASNLAGSSLTSVNLAISIAMELDQTVLLVDANLNNPKIHTMLDIEAEEGLGDYLLHDKPVHELLINPSIERLVVLPAGKPMLNSTEILRSPKMIQLVEELKNRYPSRIIIFDMPPLLAQADALSFSPFVDSVLLVIEEGHTKTDELKQAVELLKDVNILGSVFNKATDKEIKYSAESFNVY
jgi:exopolysaccharide/PEP-CTERM locus tyrosine autokinase